MKNIIAGLVTLFVVSATAQTVILFDDGLQYRGLRGLRLT